MTSQDHVTPQRSASVRILELRTELQNRIKKAFKREDFSSLKEGVWGHQYDLLLLATGILNKTHHKPDDVPGTSALRDKVARVLFQLVNDTEFLQRESAHELAQQKDKFNRLLASASQIDKSLSVIESLRQLDLMVRHG